MALLTLLHDRDIIFIIIVYYARWQPNIIYNKAYADTHL